jgi:hypothetical protein
MAYNNLHCTTVHAVMFSIIFKVHLTFHPHCCLPGRAASGSGGGNPRLPARYGSVPINDVRSNAAGSLSSLIFDKHSFQVYLQFNNTTAAYLQCCRLPMLQPSKWLPTAMLLPILQAANTLRYCMAAMLQVAPNGTAAAAYVEMLQPLASSDVAASMLQ